MLVSVRRLHAARLECPSTEDLRRALLRARNCRRPCVTERHRTEVPTVRSCREPGAAPPRRGHAEWADENAVIVQPDGEVPSFVADRVDMWSIATLAFGTGTCRGPRARLPGPDPRLKGPFVASGWGSVGRRIKEEPDVTDTDATLARLQAICLSLPDTKMSRSWGKPHFTVGGKVFAAFDEIEGEPTLSIKLAGDDADQRVLADPRLRPSRYRGGAEMLVNRIYDWDEVRALVVDSYRLVASRTSVGQAGRRGIVATRPGNDRWRGQAEALGVGASGPQQKDPLRTMR